MSVESGSIFWMFIHGIAYHAKDLKQNKNNNEKIIEILFTIDQCYPCVACRHVMQEYNKIDPVKKYSSVFEWTVHLHNYINMKLNKEIVTIDAANAIMKSFPIFMVIWKFFQCVCKDHVNVETQSYVNIMRSTVNLYFRPEDSLSFNKILSEGLNLKRSTSIIIDSIMEHPKIKHFFKPPSHLSSSSSSMITEIPEERAEIQSTLEEIQKKHLFESITSSVKESDPIAPPRSVGEYVDTWEYQIYDETFKSQTQTQYSNVRLFVSLGTQTIHTIENALLTKYNNLINEHSNIDIKFFNISDTPVHNIENTQITLNLSTTLEVPYFMNSLSISVPTTITRQGL